MSDLPVQENRYERTEDVLVDLWSLRKKLALAENDNSLSACPGSASRSNDILSF